MMSVQLQEIQPLVLCSRCEQYTNPVSMSSYDENPNPMYTWVRLAREGLVVCEFCGWKLGRVAK
jgi:hypothetical protein